MFDSIPFPAVATRLSPAEQHAHVLQYRPLCFRIVGNLARKNRHVERDDLRGVILLTLVKAASLFDPTRGLKFITYAYSACWREGVKFCLREHARGMHVPENRLLARAGSEPFRPVLLPADAGKDCAVAPGDEVPELPRSATFWRRVLRRLTARERQAMLLVYRDGLKRVDAGRVMGVSKERVRQLIANAMVRLRRRPTVRRMFEEVAA